MLVIAPPTVYLRNVRFCFEMQPSLQVDGDGHEERMIWWNIASKLWIPKKHLTYPFDTMDFPVKMFHHQEWLQGIKISLSEKAKIMNSKQRLQSSIDLSRQTFCYLEIPQHRTSGLKGKVKSFIFVLSRRADPTLNHQSAVDMGTPWGLSKEIKCTICKQVLAKLSYFLEVLCWSWQLNGGLT